MTNRLLVNIDTLNGDWCMQLDWVAIILPIRPVLGLEVERIAGNQIKQNGAAGALINIIYQQEFDADCTVKTKIGDFDQYPFSGPSKEKGFFSTSAGEAKLRTRIKICPENSIKPPDVEAKWTIGGTSLKGQTSWKGFEGDMTLAMPDVIGTHSVDLNYSINGKQNLSTNRKLLVTKYSPTFWFTTPQRSWYEKAVSWANGESVDAKIIDKVLSGSYGFGNKNWRYGYRFGSVIRCGWDNLVDDPITCNYADCYVFSDVLENMSAVLGVGGLSSVQVNGSGGGFFGGEFVTNISSSIDPAFKGNAKPLGTASYDRYRFTSHSLRKYGGGFFGGGGVFYDATFNKKYSIENAFIAFNLDGNAARDSGGRLYESTLEGARIYPLPGNVYDGWGNNEYTLPGAPLVAQKVAQAVGNVAAAAVGAQVIGSVVFRQIDANGDGLAEQVAADIDLQIVSAGIYTLKGVLKKGQRIVANRPVFESMQASAVDLNASPGVRRVTLLFSGQQIFNSGVDGPYQLETLLISNTDTAENSFATPAFSHQNFRETKTGLRAVVDEGIDVNKDGRLEGIKLTISADTIVEGPYFARGVLFAAGANIAEMSTKQTLARGLQQIVLVVPGPALRRSSQNGPYQGIVTLYDVSGHSLGSIDFITKQYLASSFAGLIEPNGAPLDQGVDLGGNRLFDLLEVTVPVIGQQGTFVVDAVLRGQGQAFVTNGQTVTLTGNAQNLKFTFAGPDIHAQQLNGPYEITLNVRDRATQSILDQVIVPDRTRNYAYTQFDARANAGLLAFAGADLGVGVDLNNNSLFDSLVVTITIDATNAGSYLVSARIVDRKETELGFFSSNVVLTAGRNSVKLTFDGRQIGDSGLDGPYFVKGLLMAGPAGANLVVTDVSQTRAFTAKQFEGFRPRVAGDLNRDGKIDLADFALFEKAYGSARGEARYNPDADFDADGRITVNDLRAMRRILSVAGVPVRR